MGSFLVWLFTTAQAAGRQRAGLVLMSSYSRFVNLMKVALPATAAALLGLIVVWPHIAPRDKAFRLALASYDTRSVELLSMTKPRYYGTDDKNQPYNLTADMGTQLDAKEQLVALDKPVANITRDGGGNVVVHSDSGFYHQKVGVLDLVGHVDVFQDHGYEMHTHSAQIEVEAGNAAGNEPTQASGPGVTIEGEGFKLWDRGQRILFTGRAKAVLTLSKSKT
jgi:lipopolysaccharide export system protein LptC